MLEQRRRRRNISNNEDEVWFLHLSFSFYRGNMAKDHFCHLCNKSFSRAYDLKRHSRDKHAGQSLNTEMKSYNPTDPPLPSFATLQHPFTCMVSGPTGSGKTKWVEQLLMDAQQMITPPPDRTIWCMAAHI